jgi:uncharacterized protein
MRLLPLILILIPSLAISQLTKEYYDNEQTQLKSETDYYKGMPHGPHFEYYKNGKLSRKGYYYRGKEDSTWVFYFENGGVKAVEHFAKGKKSGTNLYYFKSGKIAQVTKFKLGVKNNVTFDLADSTWTAYYENGKVKSRENFENIMITGR